MEVGDEVCDDVVAVAWRYDDACGGVERAEVVAVEIVENGLQGFDGGNVKNW